MKKKPDWKKYAEASNFSYAFPQALIAQKLASPRDSARLFVYLRKHNTVSYSVFSHLAEHLPKNAVLVFNETKVVPARLAVKKETGGTARILYTGNEGTLVRALGDRALRIGARLFVTPRIFFTVEGKTGSEYRLKPSFPHARLSAVFEKYGSAPIPPYVKHTPLSPGMLKKQYQTVFAKNRGSVAAPTASLHFTKRLLEIVRKTGISTKFITLHVGLGTFAPVTEENIAQGKLHTERYSINADTAVFLNKAKKDGRPIIAVGTTVVRALETSSRAQGKIIAGSGRTDLFIQEGHRFKFVDGIITNFHVPRSSLLMLVAAFVGREKLLKLYGEAIQKKFALFSFGDGMLLL